MFVFLRHTGANPIARQYRLACKISMQKDNAEIFSTNSLFL